MSQITCRQIMLVHGGKALFGMQQSETIIDGYKTNRDTKHDTNRDTNRDTKHDTNRDAKQIDVGI